MRLLLGYMILGCEVAFIGLLLLAIKNGSNHS